MKRHKVKRLEIQGDLINTYDISDQISKMLSEELAKEIDKEILKSLGRIDRRVLRMDKISKIISFV